MKKVLSIMLILCITFTLIPMTPRVFAEDDITSKDKTNYKDIINFYNKEFNTTNENITQYNELVKDSDLNKITTNKLIEENLENIDLNYEKNSYVELNYEQDTMNDEEKKTNDDSKDSINFDSENKKLITNQQNNNLDSYHKSFNDNKLFKSQSVNSLSISVDKVIIPVGELTEITITVTENGIPLANANVDLFEFGNGITDENGEFRTTILVNWGGDIPIAVNDTTFYNTLFSIVDGEAVIEVSGTDIDGNLLDNLEVHAISDGYYWRSGTGHGEYKTRLKAYKGKAFIAFANRTYSDETSYFMVKEIDVVPGVVNYVSFDGSNTVNADIILTYNNENLLYTEFWMYDARMYDHIYLGETDDFGNKNIRVTPGNYQFSIRKYDFNGEQILFNNNNIDIFTDDVLNYSWNNDNTGKINVEYLLDSEIDIYEYIIIDDFYIYLDYINTIVLPVGEHEINELGLEIYLDDKWINYNFVNLSKENEIINVTQGQNADIVKDLRNLEEQLTLNEPEIGKYNDFNFDIVNNSGYKIDSISGDFDYNDITIKLIYPNGDVVVTKEYFRNKYFYLPEDIESGTYTLEVSRDLGILYGVISSSLEFEVKGDPEVTVDKEIIPVGEPTEVIITVTDDGTPLSNVPVEVYGYGNGITDEFGQFKVVVNPNYTKRIIVKVYEKEYRDLIFAIRDDEGVIEVSGTDIDGNLLDNLDVDAISERYNSSSGTNDRQYKTRLVASQGEAIVALGNRTYNGETSYYMIKDIEVIPGEINYITFDGSNTVKIDMNFKYLNKDISYGDLWLSNKKISNESYLYLGMTYELGNKTIRVTPGLYEYTLRFDDNEFIQLSKNNLEFNNNSSEIYLWDESNTGKIKVNYVLDTEEIIKNRSIIIDGFHAFLNNANTVVLSIGEHKINYQIIELEVDNRIISYNYNNIEDDYELININSGEILEYNNDLNLKDVILEVEEINLNNIKFRFDIITNSNYKIDYISGNSDYNYTNLKLTHPNGEVTEETYYFRNNDFYLPQGLKEGTYNLEVSRDLGPLYGVVSAITQFEVKGDPEVTVDKEIIPVGEPTEVIITVTDDGTPLSNVPVEVYGYGNGLTDEQGQFKLTINPEWSDAIIIKVYDKEYYDLIFALSDEIGLIEVSGLDINGNPLSNFKAVAIGNYLHWSSKADYNQYKTKLVALKGNVKVLLTKEGYNEEPSYYMVKDIEVIPGEINYVSFDGRETVSANMNFKYKDSILTNTFILLKNEEYNMEAFLGYPDFNGDKNIRITPGIYSFKCVSNNYNEDALLLSNKNIDLTVDKELNFSWDETNTGELKIDYVLDTNETIKKLIVLDDTYINIRDNYSIILNEGQHTIRELAIRIDEDDYYYDYSFRNGNDNEEVINILPNQTLNITKDLNYAKTELYVDDIKTDFNNWFTFDIYTKAGYKLDYIYSNSENNDIHIKLTYPSGQVDEYTKYFRGKTFYLPEDAESGEYTLEVLRDTGILYGTISATTSFTLGNITELTATSVFENNYDVTTDQDITITFNAPIIESQDFNSITLKSVDNQIVPIEITKQINNNTLAIDPANDLTENTWYKVTIPSNAVKTTDGTIENLYYSFIFRTENPNATIPNYTGEQIIRTTFNNPNSLNQFEATDTYSKSLLNLIMEGLTRYNKEGLTENGIAETITISEDKKIYTFTLRDSYWSNGDKITAYDFEYAWFKVIDPNEPSPYSFLFDYIKNVKEYINGNVDKLQVGIKVIDEKTLQVELNNPTSYFLSLLSMPIYYPANKNVVENSGDTYGLDKDRLVYNGPFIITYWDNNSKLILKKNQNYWDKDNITLEYIDMTHIEDINEQIALYKSDQLDILPLTLYDYIDTYKTNNDYIKVSKPVTFYLQYNCEDEFLSNEKIRKALSMVIDRENLNYEIFNGNNIPAYGFVPSSIQGGKVRELNGNLIEDLSTNNSIIDTANQLLNEGLQEIGKTKQELEYNLSLLTYDSETAYNLALNITNSWLSNLGIDVSIEAMKFREKLSNELEGNYKISFAGWGVDYDDPMTFLEMLTTNSYNNDSRWSDTTYDNLINIANTKEGEQRLQALLDAEKYLMDKLPITPLYFRADHYLKKDYVKNLTNTLIADKDFRWITIEKEPINNNFDLNNDNSIDLLDLTLLSQHYRETNSEYDLNNDNIVDIFDLVKLARNIK